MQPRNGIVVFLAASTSLLLHAAVLSSFRSVRVGGGAGPPDRFEEMTVVFVPPDSRDADKPVAAEFQIGENGATGYASHKTDGDRTAIAREAPVDQAALSLDPIGTTPRPESPTEDAGDAAGSAPAPAIPPPAPPASAEAFRPLLRALEPIRNQLPRIAALVSTPPAAPDAAMATVPEPTAPAVPSLGQPIVVVPVEPPAPVRATPPGTSKPGGADPAPLSDSESDAFSVLGSAHFVNGEMRVRAGRKVRSRRPRIGLAGQWDAAYSRVEVTLRVAIDATGKVTAVEVAKSSGSNEIDQPCRVSMYDWWFEPKKDASGKPVPDVFNFTIGFH